jgi:hypothetical protein
MPDDDDIPPERLVRYTLAVSDEQMATIRRKMQEARRNGVPILSKQPGSPPVTMDDVNRIDEEEECP